MILEHAGDGLGEGGAERGGDCLLRFDGAMEVAQLAFGVGLAAGGFEPALQHGGCARPLRPVAISAVGGLDQGAERATAEEAFDRGGVLRPDGRDELLPVARLHGQFL